LGARRAGRSDQYGWENAFLLAPAIVNKKGGGLMMLTAKSNSIFKTTCFIIMIFWVLAPRLTYSQAGVMDFEACQDAHTPFNTGLFACSKVIGDQSQPSETRIIALMRRANIYEIANHDYLKAMSDLDQAFRLGNVNPGFYALRSRIYRESGDKSNALKDLNQFIALVPNMPIQECYHIANEYLHLGDYKRAIDYYTTLINNSNPDFAYFDMRAQAYSLAGDNEKALQDLTRAHALDVGTFNAEMAHILIRGGQLERGMAMANEAIAHSNDYGYSYEGRGVLEEALGQKDKATEDFKMAISVGATSGVGDEAAAGLKRLGGSP
jgi:tetratricopeptide (TPR) repeat protein